MQDDAAAVLVRWFEEVWNQGRYEAVDELVASHAIAFGLSETDRDLHGPSELRMFVRNMRQALPDVRIEIEDTATQQQTVAARVVLKGTHLGHGLGVPPTGNAVKVHGIVMVRIEHGKIVEGWNSWDQLGLLRQIGAIARPAEPDRFLSQQA